MFRVNLKGACVPVDMLINFKLLTVLLAILLLLNTIFAEVKDENLSLIESKTNEKGWRFDGKCEGSSADFNYQIFYYAPPKRRDLGGYGILKVKLDGVDSIYSGHEFDLSTSKNRSECGSILGRNTLLFDSGNWSRSVRYFVSINLSSGAKSVFQYNLKHTIAFKKKISNDVYLIAGFGVCKKKGALKEWTAALYCENNKNERDNLARNNLFQSVGMNLSPYIPGVGSGVFSYHVICDECNNVPLKLIEKALREYLNAVVLEKIKQLKSTGDKKSFYSALLALESTAVHVPNLEKEFSSALFLQDVPDKHIFILAFRDYWNSIFENH